MFIVLWVALVGVVWLFAGLLVVYVSRWFDFIYGACVGLVYGLVVVCLLLGLSVAFGLHIAILV